MFGRHYIDVTAKEADIIVELEEATYLNFFTFTTIVGEKNSYTVFAPRDTLYRDFGVQPRQELSTRTKQLRAASSRPVTRSLWTRCPINFANPNRGRCFRLQDQWHQAHRNRPATRASSHSTISSGWEEFLETHCGSLRRICSSMAARPSQWVFQRVMSQRNGYRGYSNMHQFPYLSTPEETFTVPDRGYFALGDNSYFSRDSRDFGAVPDQNVTGEDFSSTGPLGNVGDLFASCRHAPRQTRKRDPTEYSALKSVASQAHSVGRNLNLPFEFTLFQQVEAGLLKGNHLRFRCEI